MGKDLKEGKVPHQDKIGKVFGKLTCTGFKEYRVMPNGRNRPYFEFKCECGNTKVLRWDTVASKSSKIRSCGCETNCNGFCKESGSLYTTWRSMKSRCDYPSVPQYHNYGGRGITYCDEWKDFRTFHKWATNNGYSEGLELDRINSNGNYEPSNCRWISHKDNMRNRRNSIRIEYKGETKTLKEWCEELGLPFDTISTRYHKNHGDIAPDELFKPTKHKNKK